MQHGNGPDIIYYAYANKDFTDIEGEPKPLFLPENKKSCIDGDIIYKDGLYHLFYKTEGNGNGIKKATTSSLTSGQWTESDDYKQQTKDPVEGSGILDVYKRQIIFSDQLCANLMAFTVLAGFPFESEIRRIVSNLSVDIEIIFSSIRNQVQSLRDIHQISVIVMNKGDGIFLTEEII